MQSQYRLEAAGKSVPVKILRTEDIWIGETVVLHSLRCSKSKALGRYYLPRSDLRARETGMCSVNVGRDFTLVFTFFLLTCTLGRHQSPNVRDINFRKFTNAAPPDCGGSGRHKFST